LYGVLMSTRDDRCRTALLSQRGWSSKGKHVASQNLEAERARYALELLTEAGKPVLRPALWAEVSKKFPLTEREEQRHSGGQSRGLTNWAWATAEFVKAGWLLKGGAGAGWSITPTGVEALHREPDAERLRVEARERYTAWSRTRDEERAATLAEGIVPQGPYQEEVLRAARLFVERGLSEAARFSHRGDRCGQLM
jgi:hypothetical protein